MPDVLSGVSGAAAGAKVGSLFGPVGSGVGAVVGGIAGLFGGSKSKSVKVPDYKPLDINQLITDARTNAAQNYASSFALESQFRPGTAALRGYTDQSLTDLANGTDAGQAARNSLLGGLTGQPNALLGESAESILKQLRLGGSLDPETQNLIARTALARGGQAGLAGSGAGQGLVARDLGLTSLGLIQSRQAAAQAAGTNLEQLLQSRFGLAQSAANADASRTGLLAGIIDARALPEAGLSAGSIADLTIAQNNALNQYNLNSAAVRAGQSIANANTTSAGIAALPGAVSSLADSLKGLFKTPGIAPKG